MLKIIVRSKIGNLEKHYGKHGETQEEMEETWGELPLTWKFLRHLVTSFQEDLYRFIQTEQPTNVGESPLFLPAHFSL